MLRLSIANVLAHRGRLALTLLAVVLGVTFVAGSLALTDTSQRVLDDQFSRASAGYDLVVRRAVAFDSAMGVEVDRDPLPASVLDRITATTGVADAVGVVRGQGLLSDDRGPIVPHGPSILASWTPAPYGAFTIRAGRAPQSPDEVVIDAATAAERGIAIGDRVSVISQRTAALRVVGLAGFGDQAGLPGSTIALVAGPTAQQLLDVDGFSEIAVVADAAATVPALRDALSRDLGPQVEVAGSQDVAAASADAAKEQLAYLRIMLLALSGAALLVGAFLIANTFSIVVGQRTRELALLRAAGATAGQVLRSVLAEAVIVGLVGSVAGAALGIVAASWLRRLTTAFGVATPGGAILVRPSTILVAIGLGVLVTVLGALGPARTAARVSPVQALRAGTGPSTGRLRNAAGWTLLGVAVIAVGLVVAGGSVALVAVAGTGALLGLALLGPALAPRLARLVGRPLLAAGIPGQLARESAARAPRRTAATAMALAVGLALVSFTTMLAASAKAAFRETFAGVVTADYVLESERGEMLGGLTPQVGTAIADLPEVATASPVRYGHWKDGGAVLALTAVDPATIGSVARLHMVSGDLAALDTGGVVLSAKIAAERGLRVGDPLSMSFARTGTRTLPVVGVLDDRDALALGTGYVISLDTFDRLYTEKMYAAIYIRTADGVSAADAERALRSALADQPTVAVRDQAAAVEARNAGVDQVLGLVTVLLLFAVLIAQLGITNALALSILERTREIGLLRAVGMSRRQVRWMIRAESALVALLAVVLGLGIGIGLGAVTVPTLDPGGDIPLELPVTRLALMVAVTTVAGVLAGMLPARRAGRMDVLAAIATA